MNKRIPQIIHQIWSGIDEPLPKPFRILGDTWKRDYPNWKYEFWDNERMNIFIHEYYPQYWDIYNRFPYNVQRWDVIRYLILHKLGGMYVDFDYESIRSIDPLLEKKTCCFSVEKSYTPDKHTPIYFNNALMLSIPGHSFMDKIIKQVFSNCTLDHKKISKSEYVFKTTGPDLLVDLYENITAKEKKQIYLLPAKYVSPFTGVEAAQIRTGIINEELEWNLNEAYAVHYYCSNWATDDK